jgi:hypothetical protein
MPPFNQNPSVVPAQELSKNIEKEKFDILKFDPSNYKRIEDMPEEARGYFSYFPEHARENIEQITKNEDGEKLIVWCKFRVNKKYFLQRGQTEAQAHKEAWKKYFEEEESVNKEKIEKVKKTGLLRFLNPEAENAIKILNEDRSKLLESALASGVILEHKLEIYHSVTSFVLADKTVRSGRATIEGREYGIMQGSLYDGISGVNFYPLWSTDIFGEWRNVIDILFGDYSRFLDLKKELDLSGEPSVNLALASGIGITSRGGYENWGVEIEKGGEKWRADSSSDFKRINFTKLN